MNKKIIKNFIRLIFCIFVSIVIVFFTIAMASFLTAMAVNPNKYILELLNNHFELFMQFSIAFSIFMTCVIYHMFSKKDDGEKVNRLLKDGFTNNEMSYDNRLLYENAKKLGKDVNILQLCSQSTQLIKTVLEYNRTLCNGQQTEIDIAFENVVSEMTDMYICMEQFMIINDCRKDVNDRINMAINKVDKRYSEEKKNE